jgi:CheY-like chemotaxis protein
MPSILLVEDDPTVQNMYNFVLQHEGFIVTTAASGAEALVRVEENHFDVILLDMLMTGMSGLDFLKAYDVTTKSPDTKVIALTNMQSPAVEEKAEALGVTAYLDKASYEPAQLAAYVKSVLAAPTTQEPA